MTSDERCLTLFGEEFQNKKVYSPNSDGISELFRLFSKAEKFYAQGHYEDAFSLYLRIAKKGLMYAQSAVGFLFLVGEGVEQNKEEALKWLLKASKQGDPKANFYLGSAYLYAHGDFEVNYKLALKYLTLSAEDGFVRAYYSLAKMYRDGRGGFLDYDEAEYWLTKAAEGEDVSAQYDLGCFYSDPDMGKQDDIKSLKWFTIAAHNGDIEAQALVGECYYNGRGVKKDEKEAVKWMRSSKEKGMELVYEDNIKMDKDIDLNDWVSLCQKQKEVSRIIH